MSEDPALPLVALVGATATGKTGLSIALAHRLDAEIVNADSMQLYRGMDIGTAKIRLGEREGIPHHQLDVLAVTQEASVAAYQEQTRALVDEIRSRGRIPLMVGGSGLYIRAAVDVIEFPPTDRALRQSIAQRLKEEGPAALRRELARRDPESAAAVGDERRLVRALEVLELTGRPFTSFLPRREHHPGVLPVVQVGLRADRGALHERIAGRVRSMAAEGLEDEVRLLERAGLREGPTASRAIGYEQFLSVLDGDLTEAEAVEQTIVGTRKLARKQETWFRADPRINWLDVPAEADALPTGLIDEAERIIASAGARRSGSARGAGSSGAASRLSPGDDITHDP